MPLEHLKSSTSTAVCVKVILASGIVRRYQNFLPSAPYTFFGESYDYSPLEYSGSPRSLELDNQSATVSLPNYPVIANEVWNNNGLRKAIVIVTEFFPENSNATPIRDILTVKSSKFLQAQIEIQLQSPFSAVGAFFPSVHFRTGSGGANWSTIVGLIPEVPRTSQVNAV